MDADKRYEDKEAQTVIKVYPFALDEAYFEAKVTSDKKFGTVLSFDAHKDNRQFYSMLQYCPYQDIQENSVRIVDLPRKTRLTFVEPNELIEEKLTRLSLGDDDAVAEICVDLIARLRTETRMTSVSDAETQTDLTVRPFLPEEPRVAKVFYATGVQTNSACCRLSP